MDDIDSKKVYLVIIRDGFEDLHEQWFVSKVTGAFTICYRKFPRRFLGTTSHPEAIKGQRRVE